MMTEKKFDPRDKRKPLATEDTRIWLKWLDDTLSDYGEYIEETGDCLQFEDITPQGVDHGLQLAASIVRDCLWSCDFDSYGYPGSGDPALFYPEHSVEWESE
jgi:hypothetical protein